MPKHKINKKDAVTFQLVHRSQQDPLIADEDAPQRVLIPVKQSETRGKTRPLAKNEFPQEDDDYSDEEDFDEGVSHPGTNKSKEVKIKLELPPVVFASEVEEEVGMLGKAAPVSGLQLHLDPDIVAAMDEDFDYSDPENELEDNFIELANREGDLTEEIDENLLTDTDDDNSSFNDSDRYTFDSWHPKTNVELTMDSITSCSTIRRNDNLRLLDGKFEKMFIAYEESEIGALDLEEIEGDISSNILLDSALEEFNKSEINLENEKNINKNLATLEEMSDDEDIDKKLMTVQSSKRKWDCESILSSYSNIYNHPKKIIEEKGNKIRINKKTGIPINVFDKNGLTTKTLDKLNQKNEESFEIKSKSIPDHTSQLSMLSQRPKDETAEDRKIRKQKLKDYRKERRVEKKMNTLAFKDESKKQVKIAINNRNNVQGNKLL